MRRRALTLGFVVCLMAAGASAAPPRLVQSEPANGAQNVALDVGVIRLHFDQAMKQDSWTFWKAPQGDFPPVDRQRGAAWKAGQAGRPAHCELYLKKLEPGKTYAIQLNSAQRTGFQSAAGEPLPVTVVTFQTAAAGGGTDRTIFGPNLPGPAPGPGPAPAPAGATDLTAKLQPGYKFKVARVLAINMNVIRQEGVQQIILLVNAEFDEDVVKAQGGRLVEALRQVTKGEMKTMQGGQKNEQQLLAPGTRLRLAAKEEKWEITYADNPLMRLPDGMGDMYDGPLTWDLWPEGALQVGQQWTIRDDEVTRRLETLDARGGSLTLKLDKVVRAQNGLLTAHVSGPLKTKFPVEGTGLMMDFDAKVEAIVPLATGVPQKVSFNGKISAQGTAAVDQQGNQARFTIQGEAEYTQTTEMAPETLQAALRAQQAGPNGAPAPLRGPAGGLPVPPPAGPFLQP